MTAEELAAFAKRVRADERIRIADAVRHAPGLTHVGRGRERRSVLWSSANYADFIGGLPDA